jgi:hypothetical protein
MVSTYATTARAAQRSDGRETVQLAQADSLENSVPSGNLQRAARGLAARFGLPLPTAVVVAELAGVGGAP